MQSDALATAVDFSFAAFCAVGMVGLQVGFATLEAGMARPRFVRSVLLKNLGDFGVCATIWFLFAGELATPSAENEHEAKTRSRLFLFVAFSSTAATIVSGALIERVRVWVYLAWTAVMSAWVFPLAARAAWAGGELGWLALGARRGWYFHDYAGSVVVHVLAGASALVGCALVGRRRFLLRREGGGTASPFRHPLAQTGRHPEAEADPEATFLLQNEDRLARLEELVQGVSMLPRTGAALSWTERFDDPEADALEFRPSSPTMVVAGAFLLLGGWLAFNMSSGLTVSGADDVVVASRVGLNTMTSAAVGLSAALVGSSFRGKTRARRERTSAGVAEVPSDERALPTSSLTGESPGESVVVVGAAADAEVSGVGAADPRLGAEAAASEAAASGAAPSGAAAANGAAANATAGSELSRPPSLINFSTVGKKKTRRPGLRDVFELSSEEDAQADKRANAVAPGLTGTSCDWDSLHSTIHPRAAQPRRLSRPGRTSPSPSPVPTPTLADPTHGRANPFAPICGRGGKDWPVDSHELLAELELAGGLGSDFHGKPALGVRPRQGPGSRGETGLEGLVNSMLAALVAITGCCDRAGLGDCVLVSVAAVVANACLSAALRRLKVDDAVGAVGVHLGGGLVGGLASAFLLPSERDLMLLRTLSVNLDAAQHVWLGAATDAEARTHLHSLAAQEQRAWFALAPAGIVGLQLGSQLVGTVLLLLWAAVHAVLCFGVCSWAGVARLQPGVELLGLDVAMSLSPAPLQRAVRPSRSVVGHSVSAGFALKRSISRGKQAIFGKRDSGDQRAPAPSLPMEVLSNAVRYALALHRFGEKGRTGSRARSTIEEPAQVSQDDPGMQVGHDSLVARLRERGSSMLGGQGDTLARGLLATQLPVHRMPRVLVVTRRYLRKNKWVDFVGEHHLDLLQKFGAAPIMVPRTALTDQMLAQYMPMDGLLLVEGNDITSSHARYGEEEAKADFSDMSESVSEDGSLASGVGRSLSCGSLLPPRKKSAEGARGEGTRGEGARGEGAQVATPPLSGMPRIPEASLLERRNLASASSEDDRVADRSDSASKPVRRVQSARSCLAMHRDSSGDSALGSLAREHWRRDPSARCPPHGPAPHSQARRRSHSHSRQRGSKVHLHLSRSSGSVALLARPHSRSDGSLGRAAPAPVPPRVWDGFRGGEEADDGGAVPTDLEKMREQFPDDTETDHSKDVLEVFLLSKAYREKVPILAICRGMQMLNVLSGGTLYSDVGSELDPTKCGGSYRVEHLRPAGAADYDDHRHRLNVICGTPMEAWFADDLARVGLGDAGEEEEPWKGRGVVDAGDDDGVAPRSVAPIPLAPRTVGTHRVAAKQLHVNSYHHQGVRRLARAFRPMALSDDGLVEAYYDKSRHQPERGRFCVGLQFHPERMLADYDGCERIYREFATACAAFHSRVAEQVTAGLGALDASYSLGSPGGLRDEGDEGAAGRRA